MDTFPSNAELVVRLLLALLLGGLIGIERELSEKPAGLRTHIMVALGSAAFTLIGFQLYASLSDATDQVARIDPIRIVEGIAGGIGFLGAGAILHSQGAVEGLTTAASIWLSGAVGVACGGGSYHVALVSTGFALGTLYLLGRVERRLHRWRERRRKAPGGGERGS